MLGSYPNYEPINYCTLKTYRTVIIIFFKKGHSCNIYVATLYIPYIVIYDTVDTSNT